MKFQHTPRLLKQDETPAQPLRVLLRSMRPLMAMLALASFIGCTTGKQLGAPDGEWPHYAGDRASTKYSALDQIDAANVDRLEVAWRWTAPAPATDQRLPEGQFKCTPLMVNGTLYAVTAFSEVCAIDPATGETKWRFDPGSWRRGRPTNTGFQHRGLEYWTDGEFERLFIATGGRQLVSIDPATGQADRNFGEGGVVDLENHLDREGINWSQVGHNSPPIAVGNTIVVGSIIFDGPITKTMPPGHVRGYDARTGAHKWTFHTIPQGDEFGADTWQDEAWRYSGNTNVWPPMSADPELGYIYLPTSTPTNDWYGGHRKGDNLFAESLVCLDAETGERIWHFQAVHHGLWDYDFPCAPNLVDVVVDGKPVKAVAQVSKQGFTYVLDRRTGEPVWPIEERFVPQSDVPGEQTSPTQPIPTKPPAFERQGITEDDLIDFTPELRAEALEIVKQYQTGPIFTPPIQLGAEGKQGTLQLPGPAGGANWGGAAFDPETGILYVPSMTLPFALAVGQADPNRSDFTHTRVGNPLVVGPQGLPLLKPPYGRITAIDLNKGEIVWQSPHGDGPRNHPALAGLDLPPLGSAANGLFSNGGGVLTKTLFFIIQAEEDPTNVMRMGRTGYLRAFDKATGEKVWEREIDLTPHGTPMTYFHDGRQYIVLAAGGFGQPSQLIAFALPDENRSDESNVAAGSQPEE